MKTQIRSYFQQLQRLDLHEFNTFIFKNILFHFFKAENILPVIMATIAIGFSVLIYETQFLFIPQSNITTFASFFIFLIVVSLITLIIYPFIIIIIVNFICELFGKNFPLKILLKFILLFSGLWIGINLIPGKRIDFEVRSEILVVWLGIYFILLEVYLTHLKSHPLFKQPQIKFLVLAIISVLLFRPLIGVLLHATTVLNFTSINPKIYLTQQNCELIQLPDEDFRLSADNLIFNNSHYFTTSQGNQGCKILKNVIRYGFSSDYMLLIKKNIRPFIYHDNELYNEYVRFNCYANNCYAEEPLFTKSANDINEAILNKARK